MAHKYARSRRGPATCSLAAHCSVGSQRRRRPPPSPHRPAVVIPRAARDEVGRRRCCRVRRGPRRRVRRVPLHHGTLSPAGCFPVGPGGILPAAHITSHTLPAGAAGVPAGEGGGRRRKEAAERRRGGGGREVRAAVRRAALHRDPRHGAPLTEGRTRQHCGGCDLWSRSPAGAFGSSSLYPADVAAAVHHVLVVG